MNPEQLQQQIRAIAPQIVAWRRHLHMHPEPSFQEFETMEFVSSVLSSFGIQHQKEVACTGIVAYIAAEHHDAQAPCLGLRADLDALPIQEQNDVAYKSKVSGWMHACGHDVHTSILLGTAVVLQHNRAALKRPIKLIFQPGEEQNPGGASLMIAAGVLENPIIEELVALHVYPEMSVGKVGVKPGLYMASSDEIHVEIQGIGGHGALPERFVNPIDVGVAWMQAVRQMILEKCPSDVPQVLTFGRFEALGSTNVVTSNASIKGTFRTMNENWRMQAKKILKETAVQLAAEYGATISVNIGEGYPFLKNDPDLTHKVKDILEKELGATNVAELGLRMTAEDFAFYSQQRPVCFFRLGTSRPDQKQAPAVHHPKFDIDESALEVGVQCMVAIALS
jgi:amidohydrolase